MVVQHISNCGMSEGTEDHSQENRRLVEKKHTKLEKDRAKIMVLIEALK
jgi:hypothetical protein